MTSRFREIEKRLDRLYPRDPLMQSEVPPEERSDPDHREFVHYRVSELVTLNSVGNDLLEGHLRDGRRVSIRGNLGTAHRWLNRLGYPFIRTHRQILARLDLVSGIDQD